MKRSAETFALYLDNLQKAGTAAGASRGVGVSPITAYRWLARSRADQKLASEGESPTDFYFEYPAGSGNVDWLHGHAQAVTRAMVTAITDGALHRALYGTTVVATYQGRPVWAENAAFEETEETAAIRDDATLHMLGYPTRYLRDENFHKIPATISTPPSNELTLSVLSAFSKRFAKRLAVEHQHAHSGGVEVAHSVGTIPRRQLEQEHRAALAEVTVIETHAAPDGSDFGADQSDTVPETSIAIVPAEAALPEAPTVLRPRENLTELQRDLLERAERKGLLYGH